MIIIFQEQATEEQLMAVVDRLLQLGIEPDISRGEERIIVGAIGDEQMLTDQPLVRFPGVERVLPVVAPYRSIKRDHTRTQNVNMGEFSVGGSEFWFAAGTPMIESPEQFQSVCSTIETADGNGVLGNLFRPRRSPYSFTGLGEPGLELIQPIRKKTRLPVITTVNDTRHIDRIINNTDIILIDEDAAANLEVIEAAATSGLPLILTRAPFYSPGDFLETAEFAFNKCSGKLVLCEGGTGRTTISGERMPVRKFDFAELLWIRDETCLPLLIHPNKAVYNIIQLNSFISAAAAAGIDGMLLDVHPCPHRAMFGGHSCLKMDHLKNITAPLNKLRKIYLDGIISNV